MNNQALLDHLVTAIVIIDTELQLHYANSAAEQFLGFASHRLTSNHFTDYFLAIGISRQRLVDSVLQRQGITINTVGLTTLDQQEHVVDISISPFDEQQNCAVLELRVVDQQQRIYQQTSQDALLQAAQYLVKNLAHEIKNPLGGLRGAAQLLAKEVKQPPLTDYTDLIIEQADRLKHLVDRLLGPQKPTQHQLSNIHLVIHKVLTLIAITQPDNIDIKQDFDPSLPLVSMDAEQIEQTLLNIIQNALYALADTGGTITIKTRTEHQVTIAKKRHKLVLALSIIDDGPGIAPELMDTLFYPMVTGRADGSGLGLSICHTFVRLHQGRIDCQSSTEQTEFKILLPLQSDL